MHQLNRWFAIFAIFLTTTIMSFWLTPSSQTASAQDNDGSCFIMVTIESLTIVEDYGDGLFDNNMEIEVLLVSTLESIRLPEEGTYDIRPNDVIEFGTEGRIPAETEVATNAVYILIIERDGFFLGTAAADAITDFLVTLLPIDVDGDSAVLFSTLVEDGIGVLEGELFTDTKVAEDTIIIPFEDIDIAGPQTFVTENEAAEIVYSFELVGRCDD